MDPNQFKQFLEMQQAMITTLVSNLSIPSTSQGTGPNDFETKPTVAYVPNFDIFEPKKESFSNYKQRFENYIQMKNIISNKDYCAKLLLNSIGPSNFNIVSTLAAPKKPNDLDYDDLIKLLDDHLEPKKNVLVSQHKFLTIYQTEQQSISEFVTSLRSNITNCEFISPCECKISIADVFLRTQFIRGIKDNSIREHLLQSEISEFKDIVSKAIVLEASKLDSKLIGQKHLPSESIPDINKVFHQPTNRLVSPAPAK